MLAVQLVVVAFALAAAEKMQAPSSFMLVSGVSSPREMCLVGMGPAGALLDECTAALAELDGREVWSLTGSGSLTNLAAKKCLAAQPDAAAGSAVEAMKQGRVQPGSCRPTVHSTHHSTCVEACKMWPNGGNRRLL